MSDHDTAGMSKYGVLEDNEEGKTAADKLSKRCPVCGAALEDDAKNNVKKCPDCGTRPFER